MEGKIKFWAILGIMVLIAHLAPAIVFADDGGGDGGDSDGGDGGGGSESFDTNVISGYCGDGIIQQGEQCDDGNNADGDGCSANCQIEEDHHDIPEFTTLGAGLVLAGAGAYMYRKRSRK